MEWLAIERVSEVFSGNVNYKTNDVINVKKKFVFYKNIIIIIIIIISYIFTTGPCLSSFYVLSEG